MNDLVWISLAGAAGSFHCLGMCSGFALSLAPSRAARWRTVGRHLIYNTGRVTSYCFLGVLAGTLGHAVIQGGPVGTVQRILAVLSGVLMIVMALGFFGIRLALPKFAGDGAGLVLRGVRGLLRAPGRRRRWPSASSTACCPAPWSTPSSPGRPPPAASTRDC